MPTYRGKFGPQQAERLLWRAGFGPRPGEAKRLARKGMRGAVRSLTRPRGRARLRGPSPKDENGRPLAPADAWGHDHLWWLDRMVRSDQPLVERMTLVWHDWFATGEVGQGSLMLRQNKLFRKRALGSFRKLLLDVTRDPAMLVWLSGNVNNKWEPNENYGRELMELFTLGADAGYTEEDVREQARALTGWTNDWDDSTGMSNFRFEPEYHDAGTKRIFGRSGKFDWQDSCELCLAHKAHSGHFVDRLWSQFLPTRPPRRTRSALKRLYASGGYEVLPLVEAILMHPDLYDGPRMVKPPVVQIAGMLRARGRGIDRTSWVWIADEAGQRLFDPPNVAGWDEERWLDTAHLAGRWTAAGEASDGARAEEEGYDPDESSAAAIERALQFWGRPTITAETRAELTRFANRVEGVARADWQQASYRALRQNALRIMIATSPDYVTA